MLNDYIPFAIMCFAKNSRKHDSHLKVIYISTIEDFIQHLFATFNYLNEYPLIAEYGDEYEGHVVSFDDIDIIFFGY